MGFPNRNLKQTLTRWPYLGSDGEGGFVFGPAELLKCRWTDKIELFTDMKGDERTSNAIVYCATTIEEGDYVVLGEYLDEVNPLLVQRAYRVLQRNRITDLRSMLVQYKVYM